MNRATCSLSKRNGGPGMTAPSDMNSRIINQFAGFFSVYCLVAAAVAAVYTGEDPVSVLKDWGRIMTTPGPLVTDYIRIGSLPAALINTGACGGAMHYFMKHLPGESHGNTLAGFFLVVAHCFYGLNFLNMWPCFAAPFLYMWIRKIDFKQNLHVCMFATSFAPFISELLFRYTLGSYYQLGKVRVTSEGLFLTIIFTVMLAFVVPAILPGARAWHKGYNLYNGGLAFGLFGFLVYNFMYRTMDALPPSVLRLDNALYESVGRSYQGFATVFFLVLFLTCIMAGLHLNGGHAHGYHTLLTDTGYQSNFASKYGMPLCLINLGIYGLIFLLYVTLIIWFTPGAGFTGPTIGVVIASLTFTAMGQHPRNIWPILAGYMVFYWACTVIFILSGRGMAWSLSTQGYINGAAFATGLCPICGRYGKRAGLAAGMMCAALCTGTSALHGGLVLYNGGFTDGITAMLLLPILEHYLPVARERMDYIVLNPRDSMAMIDSSKPKGRRELPDED